MEEMHFILFIFTPGGGRVQIILTGILLAPGAESLSLCGFNKVKIQG